MTEKSIRPFDSFYDDDDDDENGNRKPPPPPPAISDIRIVKSKPPVHNKKNQSSNSPARSSDTSEHDITDVSSINETQRQQHRFQLESMKQVLLGLSDRSSGPPSPTYYNQENLNNKNIRVPMSHTKRTLDREYQQPYVHRHNKDQHRVRLTSSALNRQQQQQRIERDNLKILERLQKIRPTRSLKRDELLSNYDRLMSNLVYPIEPPVRVLRRPSSTANLTSTFSISERPYHTQSRPPSATHSISNTSLRSRPESANYRSSSAHRRIWNDRWQQQE